MTLALPVQPPIAPMLASVAPDLPRGDSWLYEPKWDGFRAVVFWDGQQMLIQSRDLKPLNFYFPELEAGLREALPGPCVLDGEVVVVGAGGLDWDALSQRIHPALSRVKLLARETPAAFVAFDLLASGEADLMAAPQAERRARLESLVGRASSPLHLTPSTRERATAANWFERFEGAGLDGVIAKPADEPYRPGERAMLKIKHQRTVDCVVSGFRWHKDHPGTAVGSLLLGLYDGDRVLHYVGGTSSFKMGERRDLVAFLEPYRGDSGFGRGRTPGEPNRWTSGKDVSWEPLRPELVCEVAFDHLQGDRFRHGATFLRWRPDKPASECTYTQIQEVAPAELREIFGP
ncbi:MAG: ATP-dependent DNA ligase [Chloroflexota bacterium]|nr:ATP-dependent DNA ligase [Chloroflexota bacterium]